jgi:hypothetical protein
MLMPSRIESLLNHSLDTLVRLEVVVLNCSYPTFRLCGSLGLICAVALTLALVGYMGLPWSVMVLLTLSSILTFFALALVTKIIIGEEQIVYYHHEIAVMTVAAIVLWLLRQPMLPYLDATVLGVGTFLSCGRIGCLMVGCCHGRPHRWGVCYRAEHAADGFARYYVGVRLFPVQAVESLWALCIVGAGSFMMVSGRPAGSVLAWYIVAYDVGRFCFEFMRGDPERLYHRGFSEAQWTSVSLTALIAMAELFGLLPLQWWHVGAAVCLVIAMIIITTVREPRRTPRYKLLHPRHIKEFAEAVEAVSRFDETSQLGRAEIQIRRTSLGVLISASAESRLAGNICHYTLSYQSDAMDEEAARVLAQLLCQFRHCGDSGELIRGRQAVFHVLIYPNLLSKRYHLEVAESTRTSLSSDAHISQTPWLESNKRVSS